MANRRCVERIVQTDSCLGCNTCTFVCPQSCLREFVDEEGFLQVAFNGDECINCGKCSTVCPTLQTSLFPVKKTVAFQLNQRYEPEESTSGGAFFAAALAVLDQGGSICSVVDAVNCKGHFAIAATSREAKMMRKSKYYRVDLTQGDLIRIRKTLESKKVLFCGLPCQVHAIKTAIPKRYHERLITADLICQGTPPFSVVGYYRDWISRKFKKSIRTHEFRAKGQSGAKYVSRIVFDDGQELLQVGDLDLFNCAFAHKLFLRESCYKCPFATKGRVGDVTFGDFWGLKAYKGDVKRNVSVVLANTQKGLSLLDAMSAYGYMEDKAFDDAAANNTPLNKPSSRPKARSVSFQLLRRFDLKVAVSLCYPKLFAKQLLSKRGRPNA